MDRGPWRARGRHNSEAEHSKTHNDGSDIPSPSPSSIGYKKVTSSTGIEGMGLYRAYTREWRSWSHLGILSPPLSSKELHRARAGQCGF